MYGIKKGFIDIVKELINKGADINIKTYTIIIKDKDIQE